MIGKNTIDLVEGTLRESSKDDSGNYLLDSGEETVYLMDKIASSMGVEFTNKEGKGKKQPHSVDAVVVRQQQREIYFIEFKNTIKSHMPKNELFAKAPDSVFTYLYAFEPEISMEEFRSKTTYIVVYNDNAPCKQKESNSQSFHLIKDKLRQQSKVEYIVDNVFWGLENLEGKLFKKVYTVEKDIFIKQLKPMIWKENQSA